MSEIGPTQIVYGILALIIIVSFLFIGVYSFSSNSRAFIDKMIGLYDDEPPIEETPESMRVEQIFFNQFFEDYQKCKKSHDTNCVCNVRSVYIPEGNYLEILNQNSVTSMSMTSGTINQRGEPTATIRTTPQFKDIEGSDTILIGPSPSMLVGNQYINTNGQFILEGYSNVQRLFLTYETDIPRNYFNPDIYSQIKFYSSEAPMGLGQNNLKGLYKIDNTQIAFVPSPHFPSESPEAPSETQLNDHKQLAQQFRSLPKCRDTIVGYDEAKEAFDEFAQYISTVILFRDDAPTPSLSNALSQDGLMKIDSENINLPENFKIKIYPKYISLFEGNKELLKKELLISKNIASGKRGTSSWKVTTQGVCSYGLNVIPHRSAQKSYSYEEGYQLSPPYELNNDIKKVSIYLTDANELCFVAYDAEHSLSATSQ